MTDQSFQQRLQRLVDGELDAPQRAELLDEGATTPDRWRDVALAFVEEQIWQGEIGNIRGDQAAPCADQQELTTPTSEPTPVTNHDNRRFNLAAMARIAVSLLIVLGAGYGLGRLSEQGTPTTPRVALEQPAAEEEKAETSVAATEPQEPEPAFRIRMVPGGGSGDKIVEIPVYEARQISRFPARQTDSESGAVAEFNRQYGSRGYRACWHTEYLTADIDDQRQVIVPVRSICMSYDGL